jgi:hypothetical protein
MSNKERDIGHIRVSGKSMQSVVKALTAKSLTEILLHRNGLSEVKDDQFYPITSYHKLLREIQVRMPSVFRKIGMLVIHEAIFPPKIQTFRQALEATDAAYYMNHTGYQDEELGHYQFGIESESVYTMTVSSLYGCDFDESILHGIANRFGTKVAIDHVAENCRNLNSPACVYRIKLLKS